MRTHINPEQVEEAYDAFSNAVQDDTVHFEIKIQPTTFMGLCQVLDWEKCKGKLPSIDDSNTMRGPCVRKDRLVYDNGEFVVAPLEENQISQSFEGLQKCFEPYLESILSIEEFQQLSFLDCAVLAVASAYVDDDQCSMQVESVVKDAKLFLENENLQTQFNDKANNNSNLASLFTMVDEVIKRVSPYVKADLKDAAVVEKSPVWKNDSSSVKLFKGQNDVSGKSSTGEHIKAADEDSVVKNTTK